MEFPADNLRLVQTSHRGAHDGDEEVEEDGDGQDAVDAQQGVDGQSEMMIFSCFGL